MTSLSMLGGMTMYSESIRNMITSPLVSKASRVLRYSSSRPTDPESLAVHNHEVCMLGIMMIDRIKSIEPNELIDEGEYLKKALMHDMEEVSTGDVPRPLKYSSTEVRESLQKVADIAARDLFTENFYYASKWYAYWERAKEDKEGHLLKLVDSLTVLRKAVYEVDTLNNKTMLDVVGNIDILFRNLKKNLDDYLSVFDYDLTKSYLTSVLTEAIEIAESCLSHNRQDNHQSPIHLAEYD